jgi:membrane carboxypeptidase/penicillin-binding protein
MLREAVVGVGVYQGMEFVLQNGMRDVAGKAGTAASRAACCAAGLRRARVWSLTLGRDHDANWQALSALLR